MENRTAGLRRDPGENSINADVVVGSTPPPAVGRRVERSLWPARLAVGRANPGVWIRLQDPLAESSAAQVASDLRRAHARDLTKHRLSGLRPGERWQAEHAPANEEPDCSRHYLWFRLVSHTENS